MKTLIAGEDIFTGDPLIELNGSVYRAVREKERKIWEICGYKSEAEALATIKGNIPEIVRRTAKYHNEE